MMLETPESDKAAALLPQHQTLSTFLEWVRLQKKLVLAEYTGDPAHSGSYELFPYTVSVEKLLAEYFDVNLDKVKQEGEQLLELRCELETSHHLLEILG